MATPELVSANKKNKDYKVTEGETFVKESGKDISIRIDHEYTENVKVEVDNQEVDKVHYKVTKGSTIITFDDMYYLAKLFLHSFPNMNEVFRLFEDNFKKLQNCNLIRRYSVQLENYLIKR